MTATPTGRVVQTPTGLDLVLTRSFRAEIDDVWASIVEPERTARWFGPWEGEAGPGKTVRLTPAFEDGAEAGDVEIRECEPPRRIVVSLASPGEAWLIEVELSERDGVTELIFTHHLAEGTDASDTGPGWEYYLDKLVASRDGAPSPQWDDYYPAQKEHYGG
jgi:uncharacterized protein YndB with AHSA1/START domain